MQLNVNLQLNVAPCLNEIVHSELHETTRKSAKRYENPRKYTLKATKAQQARRAQMTAKRAQTTAKRAQMMAKGLRRRKNQSTQRIEAIVLAPLRSVDWRNGRRGGGSVEAKILKGEAGKQPQALK